MFYESMTLSKILVTEKMYQMIQVYDDQGLIYNSAIASLNMVKV